MTADDYLEVARVYRLNAIAYARAGDIETAVFWDNLSRRYEALAFARK